MAENEEETLTSDQVKELRETAERAKALEKEFADTKAKLAEFEEDEGMKDWRKARKKIEALEKIASKSGKVYDDESGEVKSAEREFSVEDIDKRAEEAAERVLLKKSLARAQADMNEEDKGIFAKFYEKATFGETVTSDNVDEFIDLAMRLGGSKGRSDGERGAMGRGGAPRLQKKTEDFAETEAGKKVSELMFGERPEPKK